MSFRDAYKVFLGGTVKSNWRNDFLAKIQTLNENISCFNPVVENWTTSDMINEIFIKKKALYHIYVLTPNMKGVYSVAEMVESAMTHAKITLFCILEEDVDDNGEIVKWDPILRNSLNAVHNLMLSHNALYANSIEDLAKLLNTIYR